MRANPTDAERRLWSAFRAKRLFAYKFKRQEVIDFYIVDFVCYRYRLIVEADGGQHADNKYDERRDAHLRAQGFRVLRFWNNEVLANTEGVATCVLEALASPLPPTASRQASLSLSLPQGESDFEVGAVSITSK